LLVLHLWAALLASVFLLLLGATGSFMVYKREVDHILNRRLVAVRPGSPQLTLTELFTRLEKSYPGHKVTEIGFSHQPEVADEVYLDPGNGAEEMVMTVDQYTGKALGDAHCEYVCELCASISHASADGQTPASRKTDPRHDILVSAFSFLLGDHSLVPAQTLPRQLAWRRQTHQLRSSQRARSLVLAVFVLVCFNWRCDDLGRRVQQSSESAFACRFDA
jgi:hypothetical protein